MIFSIFKNTSYSYFNLLNLLECFKILIFILFFDIEKIYFQTCIFADISYLVQCNSTEEDNQNHNKLTQRNYVLKIPEEEIII